MDKERAKKAISKLIVEYEEVARQKKQKSYSEEDTIKGFILPFFDALGWNTFSKDEVSAEDHIKGAGFPDFNFKINGITQFYLEAKKLSTDLDAAEHALQVINYSWNKGINYAVLSDFESVKVFNAQRIEKVALMDKLIFEISYKKYLEDFDLLYLISKEAFTEKKLDDYAEKHGKKEKLISVATVTKKLNEDIQWARRRLTEAFQISNEKKNLSKELIDEGVQKLLDRLLFLRAAEDRGVEPNVLKNLLREAERSNEPHAPFRAMVAKFREMDTIYDSNLFTPHTFEEWDEYGGALKAVIEKLYGRSGYYTYNFRVMPADVLGSVYENYLGYKLATTKDNKATLFSDGKEKVIVSKDAKKRKEQGIYYTPPFIVDYIVRNALKPVLDKCETIDDLKKIRVLDPACGSGSFLIKALEAIAEKYREMGTHGSYIKRIIILQNLYGVDLDSQAVEIARLNLLINSLDERTELPLLDSNIKNGNSLISGTDKELEKQFGPNWRAKKAFNWKEEFPAVFKQGGFDVIIGNPPYLKELDNKELFQEIKKSNFSEYYQGKMDFWYFFLHRAIDVVKESGVVAFITNSYFLKSAGAKKLIDRLKNEMVLTLAVDFEDIPIFDDVSGRHLIHIWKKERNKNGATTKYIKLRKESFSGVIDETKSSILPYENVIKDSSISFEVGAHTEITDTLPLGDLYNVSQGVVEASDKVSKKALEKSTSPNFKHGDGIFVLSGQEVKNLRLSPQEKLLVKKYLNTNNIGKYYIDFTDEYLIYSNKEQREKIAEGEYPQIKNHLDTVRHFITSSNAPYGIHRPRENKYFENQKLICKAMFASPEFCFDDEKYYVGFSFSVIIQKNKNYNLKYLLGLLNSSFGRKWFDVNGKKRGIGVDIGVAVFRKFPVYQASPQQQKLIIVLVNKMLSLNKELHEAPEHSEKWNRIKADIEKTDRAIDAEVYHLYGLTDEEVKIVENKANTANV